MMESVLLVERLKQAIQDDYKGMREELEKASQEKKQLEDRNDTLNKLNKELKNDNVSLTQTLKELKEKYDHLHAKLKRKQDEIKKKDQWWDRYRFTAETMIKKLRTEGRFSPDVLHEVSRDLVDIMEEASSKENSRSSSSQDSEVKNTSKLTTSKDGKKRVRYTEVSPENLGTNHTGSVESKDLITSRTKTDEEPNRDVKSSTRKQNNTDLAEHPKDLAGEKKYLLGSKKQHTGDIACSWPRKNGKDKKNSEWNNSGTTNATKKDYEVPGNYPDDDETCGYPSLTSTPMFSMSNKKPFLSSTALHDISIIPKDIIENVKNPSEMNGMLGAGANLDDVDNSSPLTPAVPTIFENLLTQKTSLTSNSSSTNKSKNNEENFTTKSKNTGHFEKQPGSKDLKIEKLKPNDKDNLTSPSILKNVELRLCAANDDTIDYPAPSEENLESPSILAVDWKPVREEDCVDLKSRLNGMKRKRSSSEEEMGITQSDIKEKPAQPDKKISRRNSRKSKMAIKPLPSTNTNKPLKEAQILSEPCSIVLLSDDDEEEGMKMESSVDMFANSEKSLSKDLSSDKDVIDVRQEKGQSSKTAVPSTSRSSKNQDLDLVNDLKAEVENDLLDEEFPGFRKPEELNYKNIKVVRKKGERAKLSGFSCRDCEQYYGEMTETERKKKLKHCSRHRAKYSPPPSTPPGFWNLSFPSTQEVIEGGMMVTGDKVPDVQKPRRPRKKRFLKSIPKQPTNNR